jgi:hypothetical protein
MGSTGIRSDTPAVGPTAVRSVFALCPANTVTGGPEVIHQLIASLRSSGISASIVYVPFGDQHTVPSAYRHYDVHVGGADEITPNSIIVVPETGTWLLPHLPRSRIYFWWLSVDNFHAAAAAHWIRRLLPRPVLKRLALRIVRRRTDLHLWQSEYARTFACENGLTPSLPLSDYLGPPYNEAAALPRRGPRENLVLYNPAKGMERTKRILDQLAESSPISIESVPIRNMSREDVVGYLGRAKLYIDFGNHPGKDRLPREAVALGCCIVTNRRGSAANAVDVPIPNGYKIEDTHEGFELAVVDKIVDICSRFADHAPNFDTYRSMIAEEQWVFGQQVASIFGASIAAKQPTGLTGD